MRLYISLFFICLIVFSCNSNSDGLIAEYDDYVFTKTDLKKILPNDLSKEDSVNFVNQLIKEWSEDKILLNNSKEILSEEELTEIELKVAHYKEDLTISFIEDKLTENLNDSISNSEIEEYYKQFKDSFISKEDYISYRYMNVPKDSASVYKSLLRKEKYGELKGKLKKYNYQYDLKENNWIPKKDFLETDLFPDRIKKINLSIKNQIYTIDKKNNTYIFELTDFVKTGEAAPLPLIKDVIKNVLINKRKLNLLSEKKKELYNKALENNEIKRN